MTFPPFPRLTGLFAFAILFAAPSSQADTANQYFKEDFNDQTSSGMALSSEHLFATKAYNASGGVKVYDDFGGAGTTPSVVIFGSGEVFLVVNHDLISTTSAFGGGYSISADVSFKNAEGGSGIFGSWSGIALQVMLRMSAPTAWDGLALRFYTNGTVSLFSTSGDPGGAEHSFIQLGKPLTGFPDMLENTVNLKIVDTGREISIFTGTELVGTFENITQGSPDAGYIAIGQSAQFAGTKFNTIEVAPLHNTK